MIDECVFCKIAKGEIPSEKIYENDNFFSIPDIHPLIPGHSLIILKKHFETILDMPNSLGPEFLDCIKNTSLKLMEENKAGGFNLHMNSFKVAGQLVPHVHAHILPRKSGDGFKPCA